MKIVIAPDSFKGSLTAPQVAEAIEAGFLLVFPSIVTDKLPMADGGEGTVASLVASSDGKMQQVSVLNPLGNQIPSEFGIMGDCQTAVIEMASASGLPLISQDQQNPMLTTTYGTGQLMHAALDTGCKKLIIGIGGSATNDGGAGMAQALGAKLLDTSGNQIGFGGGSLADIDKIDISGFDPRLSEVDVVVACDVSNTLTGKDGASYVYGPQKGATLDMAEVLDRNLAHFASIIKRDLDQSVADIPGAGAAGGLGAGLIAFAGAKLQAGIDIVLEVTDFANRIQGSDLVITGEGRLDYQTAFGKTPAGVAKIAQQHNIPVIAIAGSVTEDIDKLYAIGIDAVVDIFHEPMSLETAMVNASKLITIAAERAARLIGIGLIKGKLDD
ncbi:TPA: glycerate kinase [Candidatus Poribacteria bacterium]|nr:glycerate kinase [Candidatus Poribacteria bacterium]HIA70298.1 glycerate kinase [Candidatus Poribacteria bacterium]HIB92248.1 glycerate kinase [Candidatus Poribacteria bacterium]HIC00804.1 glycerate kinase [Candidatus Poribacteria bacterium]HIN31032.1 glycerate kinase [Candidatus Poribacteria bacterium]